MMHKTKKAKFSLAIKIASMLTCVSVMAVGFASWLILRPAENKTTDGSFTVYTVEDAQLNFAVSNAEGAVVFGKNPDSTTALKWLKPSTAVGAQDLTAGFTLTISSNNTQVPLKEYADNAYIKFAPNDGNVNTTGDQDLILKAFKAALSNNAITFSASATTNVNGVTVNSASFDATKNYAMLTVPLSGVEATTMTVTVTFTFGWGSHFIIGENTAGSNPYDYYNANAYTPARATDASTYLGYIADLENGKYSVIVSLDSTVAVPDAEEEAGE